MTLPILQHISQRGNIRWTYDEIHKRIIWKWNIFASDGKWLGNWFCKIPAGVRGTSLTKKNISSRIPASLYLDCKKKHCSDVYAFNNLQLRRMNSRHDHFARHNKHCNPWLVIGVQVIPFRLSQRVFNRNGTRLSTLLGFASYFQQVSLDLSLIRFSLSSAFVAIKRVRFHWLV